MYGYIYKTTCLINSIIYVGQKKSPKFLGQKYLGSGKILKSAIKKYGRDNFKVELLEECDSFEDLNAKEIYWISKLDSTNPDVGYNILQGGQGFKGFDCGYHLGMLGKHQSDYQKQQANKAAPIIREALSKSEVRLKMSNSAKKRTKNRITNGGYVGITLNNETKMVPKNQLEKYLNLGWILGMPKSKSAKDAFKKLYAARSYIHKDSIVKCVDNSLLNDYLDAGWELGKKSKDQYKSTHHKYF